MTAMETGAAPRQTLAMRLAERNRQRALRAERLAKLRTLGPETEAATGTLAGTGAGTAGGAPEEMSAAMAPEGTPAEGPAGAAPEAAPEAVAGPAADPMPASVAVSVAATVAEATAGRAAEPVPDAAPLTPPPVVPAAAVLAGPGAGRDLEADAALADFLRALTGGVPPAPVPLPAEPGAILHFQRPADRPEAPAALAARAASGLEQLPGAGPGLVWALGRAGLDSLAAIAPLAPAELADRLGPIGRLVPAERWVATARAALAEPAPA